MAVPATVIEAHDAAPWPGHTGRTNAVDCCTTSVVHHACGTALVLDVRTPPGVLIHEVS
jgi:hypothetical protein